MIPSTTSVPVAVSGAYRDVAAGVGVVVAVEHEVNPVFVEQWLPVVAGELKVASLAAYL